jgi:hypothetical protein
MLVVLLSLPPIGRQPSESAGARRHQDAHLVGLLEQLSDVRRKGVGRALDEAVGDDEDTESHARDLLKSIDLDGERSASLSTRRSS